MVLWCFGETAIAQKLYFSNIPRLNTKAYYNRVIGENAGGIYILRFRDQDLRGGFSIERYSHNMDFVQSEGFALGKNERLLKLYSTDSGLTFVKYTVSKNGSSVQMITCGFEMDLHGEGKEVYQNPDLRIQEDAIFASYSLDRKKLGIWIAESDDKNEARYMAILTNSNGDVLHSAKIATGKELKYAEIKNASTLNNGAMAMVFVFTNESKRIAEPGYKEHFIISKSAGESGVFCGLGDHKYFLADFDLEANEYENKFLISGFYDYKKPQTAHGIVTYKFGGGDSVVAGKQIPFDREFVSALIGAKPEDQGKDAENFYVRKIVPRNDGGYLMVAENFEITQQMETFYLNGVPQTSSKSVYNYNDVILISMDSSGQMEWRHNINKRQSSFASMAYLHSMGIYVCENNVNLLYNDNSGQSNRVIHIRLARTGVLEQKIVLNSENEYTAIIPLEGKQTGYNRFVTPVMQNRQTLLLQVVDKE